MQGAASNPVQSTRDLLAAAGRDGVVRSIVDAWRSLTGGSAVRDHDRPTLVACSGGADSAALAIALATTGARIVLGHVVHDLRSECEALADRARARALADMLGVAWSEGEVAIAGRAGNAESNARAARYALLERLALEQGCAFIATGHHADDQVETVLMAAARGSGLAGLSGIEPCRRLGSGLVVVRPMLRTRRTEAQRLCGVVGYVPAEDATNRDPTRTRSGLRDGVIPLLHEAFPHLADRLGDAAHILREADRVITMQAEALWNNAETSAVSIRWPVHAFKGQSWLVVASHLRAAHARLMGGEGADRLSLRVVKPVADVCVDPKGPRGMHRWWGVAIEISTQAVEMRRETTIAAESSAESEVQP